MNRVMPQLASPLSLTDLASWARQANIAETHAFHRFAQFASLSCIAQSSFCAKKLVFKGAASLRLFYGGARMTSDMDFLVIDDELKMRSHVHSALNAGMPSYFDGRFEIMTHVVKLVRIQLINPEKKEAEAHTVEIDHQSAGIINTVQVASLEYTLGEKLAAIRFAESFTDRPQDVYDVAMACRTFRKRIKLSYVLSAFRAKAEAFGKANAPIDALPMRYKQVVERSYNGLRLEQRHRRNFAADWAEVQLFATSLAKAAAEGLADGTEEEGVY